MADEIVSALNGLSKTTQKLVDDRQAESDKADKDRKERMSALNKQIKDGDGRTKEIKEAKAELNQIKVNAKVAKSINLEISRSAAAALGISEEELRARKEQLILQKDDKVATEQLAESIKSSTVDQFAEQKNQAEILKATLEANGQIATDSKEFNKLQYEIQKSELAERLKNATSASAQKEIKAEQRALAAKQEGLLGKIAGGITSLRDGAKEKLKSAGKGVMALIKGFAIAGFAIALIAFLKSPLWEDTKNYIVDVALPKLKEFYNAFFGEGGGFMKGISELFGDESGIGSIVIGIGSVVTFLVGMKIFQIATAMVNGFKAIKAGFITMKAAMLATKASLATTLAPLLPIIAIAAAIGVVVFALKTAFDDFQKTLEETGSIGEALKVGGAKFIGFILGFIPSMITKLVGFVAGLFGFESLKEKLNAMNPIQTISDAVKKVFDGIGNFFSGIPEKVGAALGNMADMAKDFLKTVLRSVLPKPGGSMFSISGIASRAIPKGVYEFAGMNPETGELIAPVVTNAVAPNPAMAGNVAGRPNFQSLMDTRARQMTEAKLDKATGGSTVVVDAKSTNVVNSNSTSSATFTNTSTRNPNPAVAALNYSY
jgi:hypothetical protein